jgi:hypothetical protein
MENTELVEKGFCSTCASQSTEQTPGNISSVNGIGRKFYGSADPCAKCGSVIRTLWWTFIDMPVIPLGTYRYKTISDVNYRLSRFWARRTGMRWDQVLKTWAVGLAVLIVITTAIIIYKKSTGK